MDKYTREVQKVCDDYYSRTCDDGMYIPGEPIYGFRVDPPRGYILNYVRQDRLLRALSQIKFKSALEVGGGEGYSASLVKKILKIPKVELSELSQEACKRAQEIFGLKTYVADVHKLPFKDNSYDVVFSSETLEHVTDFQQAVGEMARVAKIAVVFTVPHESHETVAESKRQGHIGDHINSLSPEFLKETLSKFGSVYCEKTVTPFLIPLGAVIEASVRQYDQFHARAGYPKELIAVYNKLTPLLQRIFGEQQAGWAVSLDRFMSQYLPWHNGIVCTVMKQPGKLSKPKNINPKEIIGFKVPAHYLKQRGETKA